MFDYVVEFDELAGPVIGLQTLRYFLFHAVDFFAHGAGVLIHHIVGNGRNVILAFAKGWQKNGATFQKGRESAERCRIVIIDISEMTAREDVGREKTWWRWTF